MATKTTVVPIRMVPRYSADTDWHPADVKAALAKAGWSMRQLGFHHGYRGDSSLGEVFRRPWPRVEKLIADAIGVPAQEIWPSRYGEDGRPNRRRGRVPMRPPGVDAPD